jgi:hypothetical protein
VVAVTAAVAAATAEVVAVTAAVAAATAEVVAVTAAGAAAAVAAPVEAEMPGAVALVLAVTPAAVEEPRGLARVQKQVAPRGARTPHRTLHSMRLAPSSSKTVIIWVFLVRRSRVRASEPSSNGVGDNVRWVDRVRLS